MPNPGFECGIDRCDPIFIAIDYTGHVCEWSCPNTGTSDIYSITNPNKECFSAMPAYDYDYNDNHHVGSALPHTGYRFAGLFAYSGNYDSLCYREYLQTKLTEPLQPGEVYCAEAYVRRAQAPPFASNGLGFYFSESAVGVNHYSNLKYTPQIVHDDIITDTANWVKIYGLFEPSSAANYLTFGNFYDDPETSAIIMPLLTRDYETYSYYFVDDIRVEKMPYDNFVFQGETSVCKGDSIKISGDAGVKYVLWTTLADTSTIVSEGSLLRDKPLATTSYRVTARGCDKKVIDTITVNVKPVPEVDIGKDTTICANATLQLDAGNSSSYRWQDNSTARYFSVDRAGTFWVRVGNEHLCHDDDTISIAVKNPPFVSLGHDTLICNNDFFEMNAGSGYDEYEWSTGAFDSVYTPTAAGKYWVRAQNQCGEASDTIVVHSLGDLFIPNVLTLNTEDTLNRYFTIRGAGPNTYGKLILYNRWGNPIYANDQYKNDWPSQPDDLPAGTYYYRLSYPNCPSRKGWIKVIK